MDVFCAVVQVVPLPFAEGLPTHPPVQHLLHAAAQGAGAQPLQCFPATQLLWQCHAALLTPDATPQQLEAVFNDLLARCWESVPSSALTDGDVMSYNVLLTTDFMALAPRCSEHAGPLSVNSLGFSGTILVKDEEGIAYIKEKGPSAVLSAVGCPW